MDGERESEKGKEEERVKDMQSDRKTDINESSACVFSFFFLDFWGGNIYYIGK